MTQILANQCKILRRILPVDSHVTLLCKSKTKQRIYSGLLINRALRKLENNVLVYTTFCCEIYRDSLKRKIEQPSINDIMVMIAPSLEQKIQKLAAVIWFIEQFESLSALSPLAFNEALLTAEAHMKSAGMNENIFLCHEHSKGERVIIGFEDYSCLFALVNLTSGYIDIRNCNNPLELNCDEDSMYRDMLIQRPVYNQDVINKRLKQLDLNCK